MKMSKKVLGVVALGFVLTGCSERVIVDIKPNEVAYEVNNFANDSTQKFDGTREEWSHIRSASKMIIVPKQRVSTGLIPFVHTRRIPAKKIVVVSQNIVSKEWVKDINKGSNKTDDSFSAGSANGAEFTLGITASARIQDTDKYLSTYGVNPDSKISDTKVSAVELQYIMEKTIRPYIQGELSAEFGRLSTGEIQPKKNDVIYAVAKKTKERFSDDGIEILTFNLSGDITWIDQQIQNSINQTARLLADREKAEAEQKVASTNAETKRLVAEQESMRKANELTILARANAEKAEQERIEQEIRNKISVEKAVTDREVALQKSRIVDIEREFARIESEKNRAKAILMTAEADLERSKRWNGVEQFSNVSVMGASAVVGADGKVQTVNLVK